METPTTLDQPSCQDTGSHAMVRLLSALCGHTASMGFVETAALRASLIDLQARSAAPIETAPLDPLVEGAIQAVADHYAFLQNSQIDRARAGEARVLMLSRSLAELTSHFERTLDAIEKLALNALEAPDQAEIRRRLGYLAAEIAAKKARLPQPQEDLGAAQPSLDPTPHAADFDAVTGLPGPASALAAIANALDQRTYTHAALIGVQSMKLINSRFGRDVGDEALRHIVQAASSTLRDGDTLFRWHGPSFLALLNASHHTEGRRVELNHATQLQHTVAIGSRHVMLSLRSAVIMRPLSQFSDAVAVAACFSQFRA